MEIVKLDGVTIDRFFIHSKNIFDIFFRMEVGKVFPDGVEKKINIIYYRVSDLINREIFFEQCKKYLDENITPRIKKDWDDILKKCFARMEQDDRILIDVLDL